MSMKLVQFMDTLEDSYTIHYGIKTKQEVICGCCGGSFPLDEEGDTFKILDVYDANGEEMIQREMGY